MNFLIGIYEVYEVFSDASPPRKRTFTEAPRKFSEEPRSSKKKSKKKKKKKKVLDFVS